ncbi:HAD family hydrolase [Polymorphobacter megasporae]|uniref:HAD family hydrolase n=1 Tax=Glacieibacterium megasporae TaxID=2835787 RepID=UPI001C1E2F08|nr:HAD family hydrolase [Polymorphobacter megasporae]UAJ09866.1 HAD family hydrolase [Polymorphobacter megasporae]
MSRPLVICDCDEVLLHFVGPFGDYLAAEHDLTLNLESFALSGNIRRADGTAVEPENFLPLLNGFFDTHMPTQTPSPGAADALAALAKDCDVVILTNVDDRHNTVRTNELARLGMPYRVVTNNGPKGRPVRALMDEYGATKGAFVDDLPPHHGSVKRAAPEVFRLHMVADPRLHALIPASPDADARVDDWPSALPILQAALGVTR